MTRIKKVEMLTKEFCFPLTDKEKSFILDKANSESCVERYVRELYKKYLAYPETEPKKPAPEKMVISLKPQPAMTNATILFE